MFDLVIVGFDGSPSSRRAVDWAAIEASDRGARLEVVSCYEVPWIGRPPVTVERVDDVRRETETRLDELVAAVAAGHPGLTVEGGTQVGKPRKVLRDGAERADLVVVGTGTDSDDTGNGATARFVGRHSTGPVVLVPPVTERHHIARLIVGVDGDAADGPALHWAAAEARRRHLPLCIVHADPDCGVDARQVIERATAAVGTGIELTTVLAPTDPAPALLDGAGDGDVIVVGRRHSSAAGAALFGTCLSALVRHAHVPIVVVYGRR